METSRRRVLPWVAVAAVLLLGAVVAATQLGAGDAQVNLFSSVNSAAPLADAATSSSTASSTPSDAVVTSSPAEVTTTVSAAPPGTTVVAPGATSPPPPAASSTTRSISPPRPPAPTPKPTTPLPPPCAPAPCANVPRNSTGTVILDTRPNGGSVVVTGITQPSHGTASISDGGYTVRYTPARDYTGPDQVTANVSDSRGEGTNSTPVYIKVY